MKFVFALVLILVAVTLCGTAYGHGIGTESSVGLSNDREIKLTVELLPFDFYKSDQKIMKIDIFDQTNREALTNTNFNIEISKDNNILLDESFFTEDGTLILTDSDNDGTPDYLDPDVFQ